MKWTEEKIIKSNPDYFINNQNQFFDHFDRYKDVMAELKKEWAIDFAKTDLQWLVTNASKYSFTSKYDTTSLTNPDYQRLMEIKSNMGSENLIRTKTTIAEDWERVFVNVREQAQSLRAGKRLAENEDILMIADKIGAYMQHCINTDLIDFMQIAENYEAITLVTMEPLLMTKIGVSIFLKNWIYIHYPGNFTAILKQAYARNALIKAKTGNPFSFKKLNSHFICSKFEVTWTKKTAFTSAGILSLFTGYYYRDYLKQTPVSLKNHGFEGLIGSTLSNFRDLGGKLAYEVGYFLSHLSNEAFRGFFTAKSTVLEENIVPHLKSMIETIRGLLK